MQISIFNERSLNFCFFLFISTLGFVERQRHSGRRRRGILQGPQPHHLNYKRGECPAEHEATSGHDASERSRDEDVGRDANRQGEH